MEKTEFLCLINVNIFTDKYRSEESILVVCVDELIQQAVILQDTGKAFYIIIFFNVILIINLFKSLD